MEHIKLSSDDQLFTDYAMQLFVAFMKEGQKLVEDYIKTLDEEFSNETFTPGLVFGLLLHMMLMTKVVSSISENTIEETLNLYALEYQDNRNYFSNFPTNHPKFAKALIEEAKKNTEKE